MPFHAQARVRKIAADAAHGPRGREGGKTASYSISEISGLFCVSNEESRCHAHGQMFDILTAGDSD